MLTDTHSGQLLIILNQELLRSFRVYQFKPSEPEKIFKMISNHLVARSCF